MSNTYDAQAFCDAITARSAFERRHVKPERGDIYWQSDGTLFIPDYRPDLKEQYRILQNAVDTARDLMRRTG